MIISWLFEIGSYRWSTKNVSYDSVNYVAKVIPDSFNGITMGWDVSGSGLIYPSDISFTIDNSDSGITRQDLEEEYCTIKLIIDGSLCRSWRFEIQTAIPYYGSIDIHCVGLLQKYLTGNYPNTPHPREVWVSANHQPDDGEYDDYRIPVIFGTAYIPLMYVYDSVSATGYYVLGEDDNYTVTKVKAPPESSNLEWESADYTFNQSTNKGYKLVEFVIAPTDTVGVYTEGTWPSGEKPLVEYSKTSGPIVDPSEILSFVLQDFGVSSEDIDISETFASASSTYSSQGIEWNGGFYTLQDRESILSSLLAQCDSVLFVSDKIELIPFSKTSIETFTTSKVKKLSYSPSVLTKSTSDSGHVLWAPDGFPQSDLEGQTLVPIETSTDNPDGDTFECSFISDSEVAQRLGILYFQRKLLSKDSISFETSGTVMSTIGVIKPGNVVTINDSMLGGEQNIIVTSVTIASDLTVEISGLSYDTINEFEDISVSPIVVVSDDSTPTLGQQDEIYITGQTVFKYLSGEATPVTSPIILTATLYGSLTEYDWEYWTGSEWSNLSGAQNEQTYSMSHDNSAWGSNTVLRVRCKSGSISTEKTLVKIYDGTNGEDGETGSNGVDAGNWSSTIVFSAVDYNTVSWASGSIYTAGTTYSIASGNTGDMTASTAYYLYLKPSVSTTALQITTTASDSVGDGQILVCVAFPNSNTSVKAQFQAFGGRGGVFVNADNIAAGCITADKIASNTITSTQINTSTITIGSLSGAGDLASTNRSSLLYTDGADQTSLNTSYNTNRVAGTTASTVVSNAAAGATFTSSNAGALAYLNTVGNSQVTTISGDKIDTGAIVSSDSTMVIDLDDSFIQMGTSGGVVQFGTSTIYGSGTSLYVTGSSITVDSVNNGYIRGTNMTMQADGSTSSAQCTIDSNYKIYLEFGSYAIEAYSNRMVPTTNKTVYLGSSSMQWYQVHSGAFYDDGVLLADKLDDLYIISQYKPKQGWVYDELTGEKTKGANVIHPQTGGELIDLHSLPRWMTNYDEIVLKLKNDNGDLLTDEDIEWCLQDDDEAQWMLGRNLSAFNDLTNGALRQLDTEIIEMFELMADRITKLENQLKELKCVK